jgi:rhodanese-related sulfurtransferase
MKRFLFAVLILVLLSGCKAKLKGVATYEEWDALIASKSNYDEVVAYDLREGTTCDQGHVSGFLCIFYQNDLTIEEVKENILIVYHKDALVLLMCEDGTDSLALGEMLIDEGYTKVYYFMGGYQTYSSTKPNFVPEVGCNC